MSLEVITNKNELVALALPLLESGYQPSPKVVEQTQHVDLTTVTGPAGVGKDTIIRATGLPKVIGDTTREPRDNDGLMEKNGVEYWFRGDDLSGVYDDILTGNWVQIEPVDMGEKGIDFYGSRAHDYPEEGAALIDVIATAVPKMREMRANFHSIESVYLVKQSFNDWIKQLDGRGKLPEETRAKRLKEAHDSLDFGLQDKEMHFILNKHIEAASRELTRFAEKRTLDVVTERIARNAGNSMLRGLKHELGKSLVYPLGN